MNFELMVLHRVVACLFGFLSLVFTIHAALCLLRRASDKHNISKWSYCVGAIKNILKCNCCTNVFKSVPNPETLAIISMCLFTLCMIECAIHAFHSEIFPEDHELQEDDPIQHIKINYFAYTTFNIARIFMYSLFLSVLHYCFDDTEHHVSIRVKVFIALLFIILPTFVTVLDTLESWKIPKTLDFNTLHLLKRYTEHGANIGIMILVVVMFTRPLYRIAGKQLEHLHDDNNNKALNSLTKCILLVMIVVIFGVFVIIMISLTEYQQNNGFIYGLSSDKWYPLLWIVYYTDCFINVTCIYFYGFEFTSKTYDKICCLHCYCRKCIICCGKRINIICGNSELQLSTIKSTSSNMISIEIHHQPSMDNEKDISVIETDNTDASKTSTNSDCDRLPQDKTDRNVNLAETDKQESQKKDETFTTNDTTTNIVTLTIADALPSQNEGSNYLRSQKRDTSNVIPIQNNNQVTQPYASKHNSDKLTSVAEHSQNMVVGKHSEHCDISCCDMLYRLKETMNEYINGKVLYLKIDIELVINDYLHLLSQHNEDEKFEMIVNMFGHCDIVKCDMFKRNYRDRTLSVMNDAYNTNAIDICHQQILDKIHVFFYHSYDIGNRLPLKDQLKIYESKDDFDVDIAEHVKNPKLIELNNILSNKRKLYQRVSVLNNNRLAYKYNQLSEENNYNDNMYCFGCEFEYDGTGEETKEQESKKLIIVRKYNCLKEELIQNDIFTVTINQFNAEFKKAQYHFNADATKQKYPHIQIEYLLSLMVYCNYTELQCEFSTTYRICGGLKHNNFYHMGKYLKICVHTFGTKIIDGNIKRFYHGIGVKLLFPSIIGDKGIGVKIYGPLSTSSSQFVAANFTNNNNGLVIEFCSNQSQAKYFSASWLSDYANEQEHLFIQNDYPLQICNIQDIENEKDFDIIIKCLNIIDQIVSNQYLEESFEIALKIKKIINKKNNYKHTAHVLFKYEKKNYKKKKKKKKK
eukprot:460636_1